MKTLAIIFGTIILLLNSFILFVVLNISGSSANYRMVLADDNRFMEGVLYFGEDYMDFLEAAGGEVLANSPVPITESRAVYIAETLAFSRPHFNVVQPYYVFHDEENRVFMVIGLSANNRSMYRVIVCQNTGGVVRIIIMHGGWTDISAHL